MTPAGEEMDVEQERAALEEHSGRAAGTDAERRAARHLQGRLHSLGRPAELEPIQISPRVELAHAAHALLAIAGSLASVTNAALGASLVLAAAVLTALDVIGAMRLTRRMTGRRASQNVTSREGGEKAGVLVLVARYDAGRAATAFDRLRRRVGDPWALLLGAMVLVLGCCALRLIGAEGGALSAVQFVPTVLLVGLTALLVESALARPADADDNETGVIATLRLAELLGGRLKHFDLWVVFTGAQKPFALGMSAWLRRHRQELGSTRTVIVGIDDPGGRELLFSGRHGALLPIRAHRELVHLCRTVVEDGLEANRTIVREPVDAGVASARGLPAITLTSRGAREEAAVERTTAFCRELVRRVDAGLGPKIPRS